MMNSSVENLNIPRGRKEKNEFRIIEGWENKKWIRERTHQRGVGG